MISIVVTSYNRSALVARAIDSALEFVAGFVESEIIIVDDCSTDGTVGYITSKYQRHLADGLITIISHKKNLGVTGAKNSGVNAATGDWVMFLDSDDTLLRNAAEKVQEVIRGIPESCPVVFFRCINEEGQLVGSEQESKYWLGLAALLSEGTPGECIPVVRKSHFSRFNFDEDLRGFEGFTYAKMIQAFGPSLVSELVVRVYNTDNADRLCTQKNLRKRGCLIARGYIRMLRLFLPVLGIKGAVKYGAKAVVHLLRCMYSKAGEWFLVFATRYSRKNIGDY